MNHLRMSMVSKQSAFSIVALLLFMGTGIAAQRGTKSSGAPAAGQRLYRQGLQAAQKHDLATAIHDFRLALEYLPKSPAVHYSLGSAYLQRGDVNPAVVEFRKAIALKPDFAEAYFNMAVALQRRNDLDGAITFYKYAIHLRPQWADPHDALGFLLARRGDLKAAQKEFQKAAALNKAKVDKLAATIATNRGEKEFHEGNLDAAIQEFHSAIQKSPDFARAHYWLGRALRAKGNLAEARAEFSRAHQLDPRLREPTD